MHAHWKEWGAWAQGCVRVHVFTYAIDMRWYGITVCACVCLHIYAIDVCWYGVMVISWDSLYTTELLHVRKVWLKPVCSCMVAKNTCRVPISQSPPPSLSLAPRFTLNELSTNHSCFYSNAFPFCSSSSPLLDVNVLYAPGDICAIMIPPPEISTVLVITPVCSGAPLKICALATGCGRYIM